MTWMAKRQVSIIVALCLMAFAPLLAQVSSTRLANAAAEPGQWLMYSGSYRSERFSSLTQISAENVGRLRPVWVYQPPGTGSLETTPVVADNMMYVTSGPASVAALALKSGRPLGEWSRPMPPTVRSLGFPRVNRGVAILDGTVYVGTLDGFLVALDAKSGVERWTAQVGDNGVGHSLTMAPLAVDGKIIVG